MCGGGGSECSDGVGDGWCVSMVGGGEVGDTDEKASMMIRNATPAAVAALAAAVALRLSAVVVGRVGGRGGAREVWRAVVATSGYGGIILRKTDWVIKANS